MSYTFQADAFSVELKKNSGSRGLPELTSALNKWHPWSQGWEGRLAHLREGLLSAHCAPDPADQAEPSHHHNCPQEVK